MQVFVYFSRKKRLSVLTLVAVAEERQIGFIAAFGNLAPYDCFLHGAAGFVSMRAVTETTFPCDAEDLRKEMADFFPLKIDSAKSLDTRCVDYPTLRTSYIFLRTSYIVPSYIQLIHLAESSGVHTFVVGIGDLTGTRDLAPEKRIE